MNIELYEPTDKIRKPVSTLAMVPTSGAITRVARQAYTIMLMLAQEKGSEDSKTGMFSAPVNDIINGFEGSIGTKVVLKRHLKSMVTHVVEWQSPSVGESPDWGAFGLLSEVNVRFQNGADWVHWAYPPSLREEVLDPQRYAKLERATISKFRSHAGLALYEICARYQDNPSHLTSKREWKWWVPVLTGKPLAEDAKVEFRFFNRDTVKPAVEEVNEVSELVVELREFRVGKSIEFLQFHVAKKPSTGLDRPAPVEGSSIAKAEKLGIPEAITEELWCRYGNEVFQGALNKLAQRLTQTASPVRSRVAYLKAVLTNRELEEDVTPPDPTDSLARQTPKLNPADVSQTLLQATEQNRVAKIRGEIQTMTAAEREGLLADYKAYAIETGKHPSIIKKLDLGEWQSGLVLGELLRFYWKKTRGHDWTADHT